MNCYFQNKNNIICNKRCKNSKYSFCKRHYTKRFSEQEYENLNEIQKKNTCKCILKTGKNKDKICSQTTIRNNICYFHLKLENGYCYYLDCYNTASYKNGYCSIHLNEACCPCYKHSIDRDSICQDRFYCSLHKKEKYCSCLSKLKKKINYDIPIELIEYIFEYLPCNNLFTINSLNSYFYKKDNKPLIIYNYFKQKTYYSIYDISKLIDEIIVKVQNIFDLILRKFHINPDDPNITNISYYIGFEEGNSIVISYYYMNTMIIARKKIFIQDYILLEDDIPIFKKNLEDIYYLYLSNYSLILIDTIFIELLEKISLHYNFIVRENFKTDTDYKKMLIINHYLLTNIKHKYKYL